MKPTRQNPFLRNFLAATTLGLCLGHSSEAATLYWDGNGTGASGGPPPTTGAGGAGAWNSATNANWWTGVGPNFYQFWNAAGGEDIADFRGSVGAVTVGGTVNVNQMLIRVGTSGTTYSFTGGTVNFTGTQGIIDAFTTNSTTFASGATGNLKVQATGNTATLATATPLAITGSTSLTSFELALATDSNHVILGNAAALGTSSATVKLTKGALNLGNVSGSSNFNYNAWATDLAGGTIRARFDTGTWNGATSLSANAQLMTRNAAGAKLVFSNTATINLDVNTLNLMSGSSSGGIELNGVISGSGNLATIDNKLGGGDNGNGTTILGAANTFTGSATTTTNLGTFALGNVNALQNATLNTGAAAGTQGVTFTVAGPNTYNIGALAGSDALAIGTNTISVGTKAGSHSFAADISGSGGLTKVGATTTQTLAATTSYTGATSINAGTLALGASGGLSASSNVSIASGAIFDTSAQATYTHGTSASLSASGTSTTAAEIKGGTTVDLGSRPVTLNYTPDSFASDADSPALLISSGALSTNSPITVVNNGGTPLGVGTYVLASQTTGSITGTPTLSGTVGGSGIAAGKSAVIQVSGGNLELVVLDALPSSTTIARSGGTTATSTYGDTLEFTVNVTPSAATGTVEIRDGGISGTLIATGTLSGGTAIITPAATSFSAGNHANIVALYLGDAAYQPSASADLSPAQDIAPKELTVTGAVAQSRYFDTTTNATITGGSLVGIVPGDEAAVTLVPSGDFASASAGSAITVTSTSTLGGAKASNYSLTQPVGLFADIYGSAVWTGGAADTFWNTTTNWSPTLVPSGANVTADFSTIEIPADQPVNLNSARTIGNLTFGDTDTATAAGWTLANNGVGGNVLTLAGSTPTVTVNALGTGKAVTISAAVAGSSGLTKSGVGTLTLSSANSYSGGTSVTAGTLNFAADTSLGAVPVTATPGNINLSGGAALASTGANQVLASTRGIAIGSGGGSLVSTNGNFSYSGLITGSAPVTLTATPSTTGLLLGGQSDYTGDTTLNGPGAVFVLTGYTGTPGSVLTGPFGRGTVTFNGATTRSTTGNDTALGNAATFAADTTFLTVGGEKTLTLEGPVTLSGADRILHVSIGANVNTKSLTISGVIGNDGTTRALTKNGTGYLVLSNANTYGGNTTINDGYLTVTHNGALSSGELNINTGSERFQIANGVSVPNNIVINGGGTSFNGLIQNLNAAAGETVTVGGNITINASTFAGGHFASVGTGSVLKLDGSITSASTTVTTRDGTVVFSGGGSYATLSVTGTARVGADNGIATNATVRLGDSGNAILDLAGKNQSLVALVRPTGNTATIGNSSTATDSTLTLTGSTTTSTLIQDVLGSGDKKVNLVVNGSGQTVSLSGNNTYTGTTTVDAGTLRVNGNQSTAIGNVTVNAGTLGGTGTLGGAVTVAALGTIDPGVTTGALAVASADLSAGGTLAIQINDASTPKSDTLNVTDTLDLTGAKLVISVIGTPAEASYTLASASSISGSFLPANVTGLPVGYALEQTSTEVKLVKAGFTSWITGFGLAAGDQDPTDDPDNDGVDNLTEFALNGNPNNGSNNGLTALVLQDTNASTTNELTLVAAVRDGAVFAPAGTTQTATIDGVVYAIEGSLDLVFPGSAVSTVAGASETTPIGTTLPDITGSDWEYRTFRLDASEGLTGKGFLRAKITAAP